MNDHQVRERAWVVVVEGSAQSRHYLDGETRP
jgi:hypothetical protein